VIYVGVVYPVFQDFDCRVMFPGNDFVNARNLCIYNPEAVSKSDDR
jgi:hypothetical protein